MYHRLFIYSPVGGYLGAGFCVVKATGVKRIHTVGILYVTFGKETKLLLQKSDLWLGCHRLERRMDFKGVGNSFPSTAVTTYHILGYLKHINVVSAYGEFLR